MINWQPTCSLYEQYEQRPLVKTRYQGWGLGIDIELDVHTIHPEQSPHDITYVCIRKKLPLLIYSYDNKNAGKCLSTYSEIWLYIYNIYILFYIERYGNRYL